MNIYMERRMRWNCDSLELGFSVEITDALEAADMCAVF